MKKRLIKLFTVTSLLIMLALVALAFSSCSHSHMLTNVTVIKEATCTEDGEMEAACECGFVQKSKIPMTEHQPGSWEITKQSTCDDSGSKFIACRTCGTKLETANVAARRHDIVKVAAKAATCAETGHNEYEYCTLCDYTTYSEIQKKSHTPGTAATCTVPQICNVCEAVVANALGHVREVTEGKPATCTSKGTSDKVECTRCDSLLESSVEIPIRQHVVVTVPGVPATCSAKGYSESLVCLVCDEKIADAVTLPAGSGEHSFTAGTSRNPKCEYCDISEADCDDCEHMKKAKNEDDEDELWTVSKKGSDPTCTKYGYSAWEFCEECGTVTEELEILAPAEHKIETVEGTFATLTKLGFTDGLKCKNSSCKLVVRQQEIIPVVSASSAVDNSSTLNGGNLTYKVNDDDITCTVTGKGTCTSKEITIPERIDGYRVTAIAKEAFYGETKLTSVTLPLSVREIGDKAFASCAALTKLTIPDGAEFGNNVLLGTPSVTVDFTHTLIYVAKQIPEDCDEPGVYAHYICIYCCNRYTDADAKTQTFSVEYKDSHHFDENDKCKNCKDYENELTIASLSSVSEIKVDKGTFAKDLKLPMSVSGVVVAGEDDDEDTVKLNVIWDLKNYNPDVAGTYEVTGHVCYGKYQPKKGTTSRPGPGNTVTLKITVK